MMEPLSPHPLPLLTRHPLYAALNVLGLAVGIAVFLVLMLDVRFETSFERWIPGADQVYLRTTLVGPAGAEPPRRGAGAVRDGCRATTPIWWATRMQDLGGTVRHGAHGPRARSN